MLDSRANPFRNAGRSRTVYGAAIRNARPQQITVADARYSRGLATIRLVEHAISGMTRATAPLYFVAVARPTATPTHANADSVPTSLARCESSMTAATKAVRGTSVRT